MTNRTRTLIRLSLRQIFRTNITRIGSLNIKLRRRLTTNTTYTPTRISILSVRRMTLIGTIRHSRINTTRNRANTQGNQRQRKHTKRQFILTISLRPNRLKVTTNRLTGTRRNTSQYSIASAATTLFTTINIRRAYPRSHKRKLTLRNHRRQNRTTKLRINIKVRRSSMLTTNHRHTRVNTTHRTSVTITLFRRSTQLNRHRQTRRILVTQKQTIVSSSRLVSRQLNRRVTSTFSRHFTHPVSSRSSERIQADQAHAGNGNQSKQRGTIRRTIATS